MLLLCGHERGHALIFLREIHLCCVRGAHECMVRSQGSGKVVFPAGPLAKPGRAIQTCVARPLVCPVAFNPPETPSLEVLRPLVPKKLRPRMGVTGTGHHA